MKTVHGIVADTFGSWNILGQALVDASANVVIAVDRSGMIFLANAEAQKRFNAQAGASMQGVLPELWPMVARTLETRQRHTEPSFQFAQSDYLTRVSAILSEDGLVGALCVFEERGELENMARQMRSFQEMTREMDAIINSSSDGLFVCDAQANVIRVNPASEKIHKIKADQLIGRNMVDLIRDGFIHRSAALEVCRSKVKVSLLQLKHNRRLISTATPVFDEQGNLIRVVVSERDITELDTLQRKLEEEEALKDQFRNQVLEMQLVDLKKRQIIARSPCITKALRQALKVSAVDSTVLITGESGVGKGLIANLIHNHSGRREKPMIRINCGAIPETLIESELFGYEKGAFTGAQSNGKPGSFELADGGTLFLDEVAELPLPAQVKLLRFLEDGRITRLGGTKGRTVDARILAATHQDISEMVSRGSFRLDLFYRLNVVPLHVPPVRDRKGCILPLIRYYIDHFAAKNNIRKRLSRSAADALMAYPYPGNVRELMNICERAVVMSETEVIDLQDLAAEVLQRPDQTHEASAAWPKQMSLEQITLSVEREVLYAALKKNMNQNMIAAALGISQPTVARRLKKCGLKARAKITSHF
jgi:PAS domain S-box-containing protein